MICKSWSQSTITGLNVKGHKAVAEGSGREAWGPIIGMPNM